MNVYGPLRAVLFFYELLRLLLLVVLMIFAPPEEVNGLFFPYLVYMSTNALFPLMALFVWLRPEEYRHYLTLYMAGKVIAVVSFYAWEIFTVRRGSPAAGNMVSSLLLLGGSVFISLADILSLWGAWTLKNKFRRALALGNGGI